MKRALMVMVAALFVGGQAAAMDDAPWPSSGGGGGSTFGMQGTTATETTLAALYTIKGVSNESNLRRTFYFNSYTGSDSNDGSKFSPFRTLDKAQQQCLSYTRCIFQSGQYWSPLVLDVTTGSDYIVGEAATWDGGSSTGTVVDWDGAHEILVLEKATGTDPAAADTIVGSVSGASETVDSVTDTYGGGIPSLVAGCTNASDLCILLKSSDPDVPWYINGNNSAGTGGTVDGIIRACGNSACNSTGSVGWVVAQGLRIANADDDNFDAVGDGKLLTIASGSESIANVTSTNNNCFTSHNTSTMIVLGGWCYDHAVPSGAAGAPIAPVNSSSMAIISNGLFRYNTSGTSTGDVAILSGLDHFLIGPTVDAAGETMDAVQVTPDDAGEALTVRMARVVATGASSTTAACKFRVSNSVLATISVLMYQVSCVSSGIGLLINHDSNVAANALNLFARGLMIAGTSTGDHFQTLAAQDITGSFLDISLVEYDDDVTTGDWRIVSTSHNTRDLAAADANVTGAGWTFFANGVESTSASSPDLPWQNDAATVTIGDNACHPENECWKSFDSTYTLPMQSTLYIPAFVLGREVQAFQLGGTDYNIGAR